MYEFAELFANGLFADDDDYVVQWDPTETGRFEFGWTWADHIANAIDAERQNFHRDDSQQMPGRIHELRQNRVALSGALEDFLSQNEGVGSISDHHLLDSRRRRALYFQEQLKGGVQVYTGVGPLRPLFFRRKFHALRCLNIC